MIVPVLVAGTILTILGTPDTREAAYRKRRWRTLARFLLAAVLLSLLYGTLEDIWIWGTDKLMRVGWWAWDPAEQYAEQAVEVAKQSNALEAVLSKGHPRRVLEFGICYGVLSSRRPPSGAPGLNESKNDSQLHQLQTDAEFLRIGTVEPLVLVDIDMLGQISWHLELDDGGIAARVEQVTSPRLRHLFLLGAHVGTEITALVAQDDLTPFPPFELIGMHATLAGVPEPLWRPLARLPLGDSVQQVSSYLAAVQVLADSFQTPKPPPHPLPTQNNVPKTRPCRE
jgi:hypothetical protein